MNPGLRYLLTRPILGKARQLRRHFRGPKGFFLGAGIIVMMALVIGPQILIAFVNPEGGLTPKIAAEVRGWVPGILLFGLIIVGMSKGTLFFKPAEIQFLFRYPALSVPGFADGFELTP